MNDYTQRLISDLAIENAQLNVNNKELRYQVMDLIKELEELKKKEGATDGNT